MTDTRAPRPVWDFFCAHANEVPNVCPCPSTCGCRNYHCKGKPVPASSREAADPMPQSCPPAEQHERMRSMLQRVEWVRQSAGNKYACPICRAIADRDGGPGHTDDCELHQAICEQGLFGKPAPAERGEARPPVDWEREARILLWLTHGCPHAALYGDDGEFQCNNIRLHRPLDFKREAWNVLKAEVFQARLKEEALAAPAAQPEASQSQIEAAFTAGYHCIWTGRQYVFDPSLKPGDPEGALRAWQATLPAAPAAGEAQPSKTTGEK